MSGPVVTLHKSLPPGLRVAAWVQRLGACDPKSPAVRKIYNEAVDAGLGRELVAALEESAAADQREADALRAERENWQNLIDVVSPLMEGHPEMTIGEALQQAGYLRPQGGSQ